jgi:hypothetical protein
VVRLFELSCEDVRGIKDGRKREKAVVEWSSPKMVSIATHYIPILNPSGNRSIHVQSPAMRLLRR